ncbi:MAG: DUF87 domain-containing protein [Fischerella sp. CENA71]|nr:DUF87 domain-containing protein [Fischerella sp. CENA71]
MESRVIRTEDLDALQRNNFSAFTIPENSKSTNILLERRKLFHVKEVGYWKKITQPLTSNSSNNFSPLQTPLEDLLIGMHGRQTGIALFVDGKTYGISIYFGVWTTDTTYPEEHTLISMLQGGFPSVQIESVVPKALIRYPCSGFAIGIPTTKEKDEQELGIEVDRIIRGMSGEEWAYLILAQPIMEKDLSQLRNLVVNDVRQVESTLRSSGTSNPLTELYIELSKTLLSDLTLGLAVGSWRTAIYLMGTQSSYPRLAALWRGTFSGSKSVRDPVRCFEHEEAGRLAVKWAMPDTPGKSYHYPHLFQTWLTSSQLAAYIQFPKQETLGFTVRVVPNFDVVPAVHQGEHSLAIGKVKQALRKTVVDYTLDVNSLTRHALVAGVTGAGKTNTLFHILTRISVQSIPYLILEPSKAEYRALLSNPDLANHIRVYTPGEERISPLRLNPFEVVGWPQNAVGVHIDLLRSVFVASFGMWTPLPQILEQCLHVIYEDRGWDITTNTNRRLRERENVSLAFPTLTELSIKVEEYTRQLGYDEKVTGDLRAALLTRINGLRVGGKGAMFDTQYSNSMEDLLSQSTIMELQNMGDDDDKAFFMGLLLIRLVEYRRVQGDSNNDLRHLLVIEEAHRLLSNVPARSNEEQADPRGKAVETFANLLSEIRAYGQGVVIIDQVPIKLSPDAIKNTNLKVVHRIVSAEDRLSLAGAMAMEEEQAIRFSTLTLGEAVVFRDGEDAPLLVQVPAAKGLHGQVIPTDQQLAQRMRTATGGTTQSALLRPFSICAKACAPKVGNCQSARRLSDDPNIWRVFCRLVLSMLNDPSALDRLWGDLQAVVQNKLTFATDLDSSWICLLTHLSNRFAMRRGAQANWSYAETQTFMEQLHSVLLAKRVGQIAQSERSQFQEYARTLYAKNFQPCPACNRIYQSEEGTSHPVCIYRMAVDDLVTQGTFNTLFASAEQADTASEDKRRQQTWEVCQDAGYELVEFGEEVAPEQQALITARAKRCCLCFGQQILTKTSIRSPRIISRILDRLISEAEL